MNEPGNEISGNYFRQWIDGWNRFWFTPANPATVCLMRWLVGLMLVYTHLVWTLELEIFFSPDGVFSETWLNGYNAGSPFAWSHFGWSDSPVWLWSTHIICLAILIAFTIGLWTRWTSILAFLIVVSYANRASGALFGLDQINGFLTLYLAIAPCGLMYSLDSLRRKRKYSSARLPAQEGQGSGNAALETTLTNVATRLMQIHLCVVYLFAGLGKLQGASWWDGTAIWGALASYEYQTLDMTFMVYLPWLVNIVTLGSVFWEVSYPFLVWPRLTRPIVLLVAVAIHLGIGICMGMVTFGLIMLVANLSFVSPERCQIVVQGLMRRLRSERP